MGNEQQSLEKMVSAQYARKLVAIAFTVGFCLGALVIYFGWRYWVLQ